jgi:ADP-ribosylglycohydrolase
MDTIPYIIGAVAGDVIGSVYEWRNVKTVEFGLFRKESTFTDDSVLTVATMDALLTKSDYATAYRTYARTYPGRGYGGRFRKWIHSSDPQPYNSWGNGSAMRVSPVGWACNDLHDVLREAQKSAEVTHNHPEGIKGAQATAAAVFLARNNTSKEEIKQYITETFQYNLNRTIEDIRPGYSFDESCQGSVPEAIIAFLESSGYEDAVRLAVSIGGDSDTIACIAGGIAEAYYKTTPAFIVEQVMSRLPDALRTPLEAFSMQYGRRL